MNSLVLAYEDGTDTNRIESFFARAERSYVGTHHRFSLKYLDWYMAMVAWKEDTRYMGLRWQLADVLCTVTHRTTSKNLFGYWQSAAERIEDPVWTEKTAVIEATIPAVTDLGFVNFSDVY
ncbi:hypothetical protein GR247_04345 [Rhizobium leguminosarum]|nr:hypothetical protein [Rhizobium leguminosarum]